MCIALFSSKQHIKLKRTKFGADFVSHMSLSPCSCKISETKKGSTASQQKVS